LYEVLGIQPFFHPISPVRVILVPNSSMKFSGTIIFATVIPIATIFASSQRNPIMDVKRMHARDVITRDVCVIGGGASGTYGAIRLNDLGKSVVVVEQQPQLGGQTETYTDLASGNKTEMGVVAWYTNDIVNNFFARLNVSLKVVDVERAGFTTLASIPVDFRTGKVVENIYSGNVT
jgi:NADPH-dependent 2,4-dienoyl-CoA reductase/sulfur reductase-like enzyme